MKQFNFILLAGGKGSRMQSDIPKVLYPVNDGVSNLSTLERIVNLIKSIENIEKEIYAVISTEIFENVEYRQKIPTTISKYIVQQEKLGTGNAVKIATEIINVNFENTIIIYCDHATLTENTILQLAELLNEKMFCSLSFFRNDNNNYGKSVINFNGQEQNLKLENYLNKSFPLIEIKEQKEFTDKDERCNFCNSGVFAIKTETLLENINNIQRSTETGEYYFTLMPKIINHNSQFNECSTLIVAEEELLGFNTLEELRIVEKILQKKIIFNNI